jgi:thiol:disulfide interchange protein
MEQLSGVADLLSMPPEWAGDRQHERRRPVEMHDLWRVWVDAVRMLRSRAARPAMLAVAVMLSAAAGGAAFAQASDSGGTSGLTGLSGGGMPSGGPAGRTDGGKPGSGGAAGGFGGLDDLNRISEQASAGEPVTVSATLLRRTVNPGAELAVAIELTTADGWKVWPGVGQDVLPANVDELAIRTAAAVGKPTASMNPGGGLTTDRPSWVFAAGRVQWPTPSEASNPLGGEPAMVPVIAGESVAYMPVLVTTNIEPGEYTLPVTVRWQSCDADTCLPPAVKTIDLAFEVVAPGETGGLPERDEQAIAALFDEFDESVFASLREGEPEFIEFDAFGWTVTIDASGFVGLGLLLVIAAFGGFLLNFTPCVLPVIPLKVMGLAQHAGDAKRTLFLGVVMSAGVVFFWLVLGGLVAFVSGFNAISALFQVPWFTLGVGVFIAAMAVGMLGLFTIQLPQSVYMVNPSQESVPGSFLFGIMTAILSTPCTAPFMGAAAAWAAAQENKAIVLGTFTAIGVGMALPYFVLSANPKWVSKLPKAGEGSEVVKKTMGLLMLAVAAFFAGTGLSGVLTTAPDPPSKLYWWVVGGFVALAGVYVLVKTVKLAKRRRAIVAFSVLGVFFMALGAVGPVSFTAKGPIDWVYYTPERFDAARDDGDVIVLDFTAEWCLNCKALEEAVLFRERVHTRLNGPGVVPMKIDLTGSNPDGQAKLDELGRVAIPLLAVFGPERAEPVFMSDAYTVQQVLDAIDEAWGGAAVEADDIAPEEPGE